MTNLISKIALIGTLGLVACVAKSDTQKRSLEAEPQRIEIYNPYNKESYTSSQSGVSVALGDIDGDRDLDLIVGSPTSVKYFKNVGMGRFEEKQNIYMPYDESHTSSQSGVSVALGDIDGDQDLDLIVGSPSSVRAFINVNGIFEPQLETITEMEKKRPGNKK